MTDRARTVRRIVALVAACIAVGVGVTLGIRWWIGRQPEPQAAPPAFPIPSYSASRYLNTAPDAKHIGSTACAECHKENHKSYLLTPHSRALSYLDPNAEPPDATFHHAASGRDYRVYRKGNEFRHEELLRTSDGTEISRIDLPVKYLIGSGNFCRSYLIEVDGFLHESPITWYTQKKKWDMSPGYDFPQHWSFERPVRVGCLHCHAGRVEPQGEAVHKMTLHEQAIGCESCHGPGSRHAELQRNGKPPPGEDLTIVHPGRLPRDRLEAICSVCHLSGSAAVLLRGRRETDFRPGMPLSDYRIDYHLDSGGEQMTVVGHMQQLRQSKCYQKSDMTCLTCHDPHIPERPKDTVEFYRQKCLSCHQSRGCTEPIAERTKLQPTDNCSACHMPRGDTDIPHVAFTHHRIGLHWAHSAKKEHTGTPELVTDADLTHLDPIENQRNLGIAYLKLTENESPETVQFSTVFAERARINLDAVYSAGLRDGLTLTSLADCYRMTDPDRAGRYAKEALQANDLSPEARAKALLLLSDYYLKEKDYPAAIGLLEDLVRRRRFAEDWRLLGAAYQLDYEPQKALSALKQALAIRPTRHDVHAAIADVYFQQGDWVRAREHRQKAEWLFRNRQE
jgi:predicted CXXCH cytochrome family protein